MASSRDSEPDGASQMDVPSASTNMAPRSRTPPMRRSCELCRASKTKCLPSGDPANKDCQRCVRDGKECYFAPAQQRAKRAHKSNLRVAEMEKKLDGIFALLSNGQSNSQKSPITLPQHPPAPSAAAQGPSPPETVSSSTSPHPSVSSATTSSIQTLAAEQDNACADFFGGGSNNPDDPKTPGADAYHDLIERGLIHPVAASVYVSRFKAHAPYFPFVILSPEASVEELRRDRPFLLIAIITMAAPLHSNEQVVAEREFREHFAKRFIVEGEGSLDLLQGLMIYIMWYHRYFHPQRQNFWAFTQIAISIAVELGITKGKKPPSTGVDPFDENCGPEPLPLGKASAVEARRTFLGVYWLSAMLSNAIRKQQTFRYTSYIEDCCSLLAELHEAPTDVLLGPYIQLAKLSDDVGQTFGFDGGVDTRTLSSVHIEMSLKSFQSRLQDIRKDFSKETEETAPLTMLWCYMKMYVNEISLYAPHESPHSAGHGHSWISSPVRTSTFIEFIAAAKALLDDFIKMPWSDFQRGTAVETTRLIYSIMLLTFAAIDIQSPPLPLTDIQQTIQLPAYLDALSNLVGSHVTVIDGTERRDLYWQFRFMFTSAKGRYLRRIATQTDSSQATPADSSEGVVSSYSLKNVAIDDENMLVDDAQQQSALANDAQWSGLQYSYGMDISDDQFWTDMLSMPLVMDGFN